MDPHRRTAPSTPRCDPGRRGRPRSLGSVSWRARAVLGLALALLAPSAGAGPQDELQSLADWDYAADYTLWAAERTEEHAEPFSFWYAVLEQERYRAGHLEGLEAQALTTCAVALTEALPAWRKLPLTGLELADFDHKTICSVEDALAILRSETG